MSSNYFCFYFILIFIILSICHVNTLNNYQALTPPMGWSAWFPYSCTTDCQNGDRNCLCEKEIRGVADILADKYKGYLEAGYEYVILDDCWQERNRENGRLVANRKRFPSGMKDLSNYLHKKGLKLGLFSDIGPKTGQGYPGTKNHLAIDAQTFNEWGVDYVKMSGYKANRNMMDKTYPEFQKNLNYNTVFACSWPYYQGGYGHADYNKVAEYCNTWRMDDDMDGTWDTIKKVIEHAKEKNDKVYKRDKMENFVKPGAWADLDLLMVGNENWYLTHEQTKTQMAMWAMLASPLIISTNIVNILPEDQNIILDKRVIEINQDKLGIRGKYLYETENVQVWTRKIKSKGPYGGIAFALAFVNFNDYEIQFETNLLNFELPDLTYKTTQIWGQGVNTERIYDKRNTITMNINPCGTNLYRAEPTSGYYEFLPKYESSQRYYIRSGSQRIPEIIDDHYLRRGQPFQGYSFKDNTNPVQIIDSRA